MGWRGTREGGEEEKGEGEIQKCSTSFPGGGQVDGLPPAQQLLLVLLLLRVLSVVIGRYLVCAILHAYLSLAKLSPSPRKSTVA